MKVIKIFIPVILISLLLISCSPSISNNAEDSAKKYFEDFMQIVQSGDQIDENQYFSSDFKDDLRIPWIKLFLDQKPVFVKTMKDESYSNMLTLLYKPTELKYEGLTFAIMLSKDNSKKWLISARGFYQTSDQLQDQFVDEAKEKYYTPDY